MLSELTESVNSSSSSSSSFPAAPATAAASCTADTGRRALTPRGGAAAEREIGVRTLCRQGDDCPGIWEGAELRRPQHARSCCEDGAMAGRRGKSAGLESAGAAAFAVEHGIVILRVGVARRRRVVVLRAAAERGWRREMRHASRAG